MLIFNQSFKIASRMKNKLRILIGMTLALALTSCSKSYLNEPKPTDGVTDDKVFSSAENVRIYFNGIYRQFRSQAPYGKQDAFAINSVNIARENKGIDFVNQQSWFIYDYEQDNRSPTYRRVTFTWRYFYEFINQANNVIYNVEKATTIASSDKLALTSEAKALRAFCLFELTREFSKAFLEDSTAAGVPIYTTPTYDSIAGNPRGTLKEDYDQIISDLTTAIPNLPTTRSMPD